MNSSELEIKPVTQNTFENAEIGYLCSAVLKTQQGSALIAWLKDRHMYRSPFAAYDPAYGTLENFLFFRQGHADLIRFIEQQARAYEEQKK